MGKKGEKREFRGKKGNSDVKKEKVEGYAEVKQESKLNPSH